MRFAIVSDIHANWQAWEAVLTDILQHNCDEIICLGDIVGYGPSPADVLISVREYTKHFVIGNHDAVIGGRFDASLFNDGAKKLIEWTDAQLDGQAREFFSTLPFEYKNEFFHCTHSCIAEPENFPYVYDIEASKKSFAASDRQVLFIGHTHIPQYFTKHKTSQEVQENTAQDFVLNDDCQYLINVGAVGDPRDGSQLASYAIYDTELKSIYYRQIPFDIKAFEEELKATALNNTPSFLKDHEMAQKETETIRCDTPAASSTNLFHTLLQKQAAIAMQKTVTNTNTQCLKPIKPFQPSTPQESLRKTSKIKRIRNSDTPKKKLSQRNRSKQPTPDAIAATPASKKSSAKIILISMIVLTNLIWLGYFLSRPNKPPVETKNTAKPSAQKTPVLAKAKKYTLVTKPIFEKESTWHYYDQAYFDNWFKEKYDYSKWSTGQGRLGYGGDGELTMLNYGPNSKNKNNACFFRKAISIKDITKVEALNLHYCYDDGIIVYINGQEAFRKNMPYTDLNNTTLAKQVSSRDQEQSFHEIKLDLSLFKKGINQIAVGVFQQSPKSSDLGFDASLIIREKVEDFSF